MAGKKVNRLIVPNTYYVDGMAPVTSVNNILPVNGNVTLPIPTVPTNVSAFTNDAGYLTSATLDGYATQLWVQQQGYLTSIPNTYLQNTSNHSNSLCIYGTLTSGMASYEYGTAVGYNTQAGAYSNAFGWNAQATGSWAEAFGGNCDASGNWSIRIGHNGDAHGNYSIAIGPSATTSASYAIQLGEGTNSTASSLQIGFGTNKNYTLLNGTTGLIPDARISSNIARTTDIPDVSNFVTNSSLSTTLADYTLSSSLATVATSGSYSDLSNKPTIPAAQVQSDWNQTDNTAVDFIKNKPTIPSGVVVDQTYDGTSTNAQSGVAIANELINYIDKTTAYQYISGTKIFTNSSDLGFLNGSRIDCSDGCAVHNITDFWLRGRSTNFQYPRSIVSDANGIVITKQGLTQKTDFTIDGNKIYDADTGLVPDARISTNIARTSQLPTVPTNISSFTNDSGYITGITYSDVTSALGYTPYNSSNPNGYTSNTGTVTSVNNVAPVDGNVTLSIPTVPTNVSAFTNDSGYQTSGDVNTIVTSAISTLLSNIYPIGSIYIGTQATCPLAALISGSTWELVAADRVLQGSSTNHAANTTVAAGLPNITGTASGSRDANSTKTGAFSGSTFTASQYIGHSAVSGYSYYLYKFDASDSNVIYGNATTVQPPAYVVNIWRRTA